MLNVANAVAHHCVGPHRKKRTTEETCRKSMIMAWLWRLNLPVQEPTKFPLLINAKSAKAIGISFPPALIVAADEVID
jgi:hypothetical protein